MCYRLKMWAHHTFWAAKLLIIFQITKNYMFFQSQIGVFL